jgi:Ca-activated chloride channel family protein
MEKIIVFATIFCCLTFFGAGSNAEPLYQLAPPGAAAQQPGQQNEAPPRFSVKVPTVIVRVSVTDPLDRYVVGLQNIHFQVFENKIEQPISIFSNDADPISVGIILDTSGSMGDNMLSARTSVNRFLSQGSPEDEYLLIGFNNRTVLLQDFTSNSRNIINEASFASPGGETALFDAIYLGLEKIKESKNRKKALIVITDGENNASRYTFREVKEFARESDVQIYIIGERGEQGFGRNIISEIVSLTGGRAFFPHNFKQLDYYIDLIHTELRNQYILGYVPLDQEFNGDWRELKVVLNPPEGMPKLSLRAREGYYSPNLTN